MKLFPVFEFFRTEYQPEHRPQPKVKKKAVKAPKKTGTILIPGKAVNPFDPERYDQLFEILLSDYESVGERDAFLAASRMGKSHLMGVVLEQYLDQKGIVCVVDPQGEWYTLQDEYPVIVVGGNISGRRDYFNSDDRLSPKKKKLRLDQLNKRVPIDFKESDYKIHDGMDKDEKMAIAERKERDVRELELVINNLVQGMLTKGFSLVFDLTAQVKTSDKQFISCLIMEALRRHNNAMRRKMKLVVDEAHNLAPEKKSCASLDALVAIAKEGAKEGIDLMISTQSCASISKEVVKQCNRFWLGGVRERNDVAAIESFFGKNGSVKADDIKALPPRHFYFNSDGRVVKFQPGARKCEHGGGTPTFKADAPVASMEDMDTFLKNLKMG